MIVQIKHDKEYGYLEALFPLDCDDVKWAYPIIGNIESIRSEIKTRAIEKYGKEVIFDE